VELSIFLPVSTGVDMDAQTGNLMAGHEIDGRRRRSQASRDRIMDAVIALIDENQGVPGAEAIAARAGVGLRSVFRHFGDLDGLYEMVIDRIGLRFTHLVKPYESPDWKGQVREGLERRMIMFFGALPYRRFAEVYRQQSEKMRHGLDALNRMLRGRLEGIVPEDLRADRLWFEQLDLWLSLETYARLRDLQGLDHATASAVIEAAVETLLAAKS
jgi:AcrR family transcriptional regulator